MCIRDSYMGEPEFRELWAEIYAKQLTAMIHPEGVADLWFQKFRMWNSIGQPIEEAKLITSLIDVYKRQLHGHKETSLDQECYG